MTHAEHYFTTVRVSPLLSTLFWYSAALTIFYIQSIFGLILLSILFMCYSLYTRPQISILLVHVLCIVLGLLRMHTLEQSYTHAQEQATGVHTIRATVIRTSSYHQAYYETELTLTDAVIDAAPFGYTIRCRIHGNNNLLPGDRIQVTASLKPLIHQTLAQAMSRGIPIQCSISANNLTRVSMPFVQRLRFIFPRLKELLKQRLLRLMNKPTGQLFCALFLGSSQPGAYTTLTKKQFNRWGIGHMFARSGLHIMILIGLWSFILSCIPISILFRQFLLLLCLLLYILLSWSSISFMRACLMFVCSQYLVLRRLSISSLYTFTATAMFLLLYNPYGLFELDFQLSFSITLGIILWHQIYASAKRESIANTLVPFLH